MIEYQDFITQVRKLAEIFGCNPVFNCKGNNERASNYKWKSAVYVCIVSVVPSRVRLLITLTVQ